MEELQTFSYFSFNLCILVAFQRKIYIDLELLDKKLQVKNYFFFSSANKFWFFLISINTEIII